LRHCDPDRARTLAAQLDQLNQERQQSEAETLATAVKNRSWSILWPTMQSK
jgi:single-stranded DNA-specific DHH superfamily exonuclease